MQDVMEDRPSGLHRSRIAGDVIGAVVAAGLVVVAFVVPRIASKQWFDSLYAAAAPLFGYWLPHVGWGTVPAVAVSLAVATYGPALAARLGWRPLLVVAFFGSLTWTFSLAMVDGWHRGFVERFEDPNEYLHEVGGVSDIPAMLSGFTDRILDFQPDSWTTHVSGHPPGALLFFVVADRLGADGPVWAAVLCMLIGCSAVIAVPVALRALGAEDKARAVLPFVVLAPAALWLAVSADAMFAGVTAWAVALFALAARRGRSMAGIGTAVASGVLFAAGIYLNYGLVLMALIALAVLLGARTVRPLVPAIFGALLVVAVFTALGFWWFDGYELVVQRYYQGIASVRPFGYWGWANLAATVCAVGLATAAALHRVVRPSRLRALDPTALLASAALLAILAANISGLSKAETERIWLPFDIWLLTATAFLPREHMRTWLGVQAVGTLVLAHIVMTNW